MSNNAVSVKNLSKVYKLYEDKWGPIKEVVTRQKLHKDFRALQDITLDFPKGESIGVLGKNGSGKSTLLKIITGIAEPSSGVVEVDGSLVFLDVSSGIDAEMTGYDNIFMKGTLLGYTKEEMLAKVDDIIAFSELEEFINQPVKNYSSGMRAKLGFAISVNVNPDILIVDEALAVGDSVFREKCMRKMNEFKEQGKTIIFVSHDKNAVENFCTKAAWIHKGELIMYGGSKVVGSYYNDFMSGKQTLESIKAQAAFIHGVESIRVQEKDERFSVEISGYVYGEAADDFSIVMRNNRTKEGFEVPIKRSEYKGTALIPEDQKSSSGFTAVISETSKTGFTPDTYSVRLKTDIDGETIEFPPYAEKIDGLKEANEAAGNWRFPTSFNINQSGLVMKRENAVKLEQQTNKVHYDGEHLVFEGVAFARGYETPEASAVNIRMFLKETTGFDLVEAQTKVTYTEEVTENQSFNPNGRNYNHAGFTARLNAADLSPGTYDAYISASFRNGPELCVAMWASKQDQYDNKPYNFGKSEIQLHTENKYVTVVSKG